MISRYQITAARALLEWTQDNLANAAGMTKEMISKIEGGKSAGSLKSLQQIQQAFDSAGIAFQENDGVARKSGGVQTFRGRSGFLDFIMDVYETVKFGGDVYVSNVNENDFLKWEGDEADAHMARMASIANLKCRFLIQEGDTNIIGSHYATYRYVKKENFDDIPLYIYGEKSALIVFKEDDVEVFVIRHAEITRYFRKRFQDLWNSSQEVHLK